MNEIECKPVVDIEGIRAKIVSLMEKREELVDEIAMIESELCDIRNLLETINF